MHPSTCAFLTGIEASHEIVVNPERSNSSFLLLTPLFHSLSPWRDCPTRLLIFIWDPSAGGTGFRSLRKMVGWCHRKNPHSCADCLRPAQTPWSASSRNMRTELSTLTPSMRSPSGTERVQDRRSSRPIAGCCKPSTGTQSPPDPTS